LLLHIVPSFAASTEMTTYSRDADGC